MTFVIFKSSYQTVEHSAVENRLFVDMKDLAIAEKTTLIIGASTNPGRMSNMVTQELRQRGVTVHAIGARAGQIADVDIHTNPQDFAGEKIHTVGMYINPDLQPQYYDFVLALKPKRIYFNPGTENPIFFQKAKAAGLHPMDACMMVALTLGSF